MNWGIIKKQLLVELRTFGTYIWLILFPLAMIMVLGNVLTNVFNKTVLKTEKVTVIYQLPEKQQPLAAAFANFAQNAGSRYITFKQILNKEVALKKVQRGSKTAAAIIDNGRIIVYTHNPDVLQSSILAAHFQGFAKEYAISATLAQSGTATAQLNDKVPDYTKQVKVEKNNGVKQPSAFQYYAISMITMSCLITMIIGARLFSMERQRRTLARMYIAPVPKFQIIISNFLGSFILRACSLLLLMFVVSKFFAVNWGSNVILIFVTFLSLIMFAMLLGIAIDILAKGARGVTTITSIVMQLFLFFGGAYFPVSHNQAMLSPAGWVLIAVREAVYAKQVTTIAWVPGILLLLSSLLVIVCVAFSRRRGGVA